MGAKVTLLDKGQVGKSGLTPFWQGTAVYDPKYEKKWGLTEEKFTNAILKGEEYLMNQDYLKLFIKKSYKNRKPGESFGMLGAKKNQRGPNLQGAYR
jgi:succinate dehydrogenase/fumarate reductase flavoprotein subunit